MNRKIKICHVIGDFVNGGVESVIYNYFSHMDLSKFEVHIIGHGIKVQECADRFINMGFIIHNITPKSVNFVSNVCEMKNIFDKYKFDIVHSHITEWACVPLFLGLLSGIKVRINHSHMAEKPQGLNNKIYYGVRLFFGKLFATDYFACGYDAAIYLFGKKTFDDGKVTILPNAFDLVMFNYNVENRVTIREQLEIPESTLCVGHIGRFEKQKNHDYLIQIFEELRRIVPDSCLLLVGKGQLETTIKEKVEKFGISEHVKFLGSRSDVAKLYQGMDIFVFPSLYEGLGIVTVEAQVSNLPVLAADAIPHEAKLIGSMQFMSLDIPASSWASKIIEMTCVKDRKYMGDFISEKGYDIETAASKLSEVYTSMLIKSQIK